jgi:hypothetical protein
MARSEVTCTRCHQVNVRHSGWAGFFLNPRWAWTCTLCGTPLDGSPRGRVDEVRSWFMWSTAYLGHALAGLGLAVLLSLLWPGLINQPLAVRLAPMALGVVLGLMLAERSRRAGTLLGRRKPARDRAAASRKGPR